MQLNDAELRGLTLFEDENTANCAACHPSTPIAGQAPLFTDFSYDNLGLPFNMQLKGKFAADKFVFDVIYRKIWQ